VYALWNFATLGPNEADVHTLQAFPPQYKLDNIIVPGLFSMVIKLT
jgi:hypothetical protein